MNRALIRAACVSWIGAGVCGTAGASIGITAIGGLDVPGISVANGVSADGSVVIGRSWTTGGVQRAFRWTGAGGIEDVGLALGGPWGSEALAASAHGNVVVGMTTVVGQSQYQPFRWSGGPGQILSLPAGDSGAEARACSADGSVVVGRSYRQGADGGWRAVRWNAAGVAEVMSEDAGFAWNFSATGVSADGSVITGTYGGQVFRWTSHSGFEAIAGDVSAPSAYALSGDGSTIVGTCFFPGMPQSAFRWTEAGGFENLGSLPGVWANAYAANGDGSMVGGESGGHAFLWTPSTGVVELGAYLAGMGVDVSRWDLWDVKGISADGTTLVGTGALDHAGTTAWVLTGLPAPGSGAVMLAAGLMACRRRR